MKKEIKKQKGITLIALILTIIVLLILAGISVSLLTGEDNIIQKAKTAKARYNEASIRENIQAMLLDAQYEKISNNKTLKEYLEENKEKNGITSIVENEDGTITIIVDEYDFKIDEETLKIIYQESISLNKSTLTLEILDGVNMQETLVATKTNIEGTVSWTSSVPTVATVDNNGKVTTVGAGETIITVSCNGYSSICKVTVTTKTTPKVTLSATSGEIDVENTLELTATLNITAEENIVWTSSDNRIATVVGSGINNSIGTITGLKEGTVTITASYGDKIANCSVTVKEDVNLISFKIEGYKSEETFYAVDGWNWFTWCGSEYNTLGSYFCLSLNDYVYVENSDGTGWCVVNPSGSSVFGSNLIVDGANYLLEPALLPN